MISFHELLALFIIGAIVFVIAWQLIRRDERKQEAVIAQEGSSPSHKDMASWYAAMALVDIAIAQLPDKQEITEPIDTEALEASLQDEDEENSQIEGLLEDVLPLIPLTDEEIDAILARPLSEADEAEIAQAAERARKRLRDKLNRDNWRMGLNSGSRERIDSGDE